MKMTRRDILKLVAGSATGLLFTPVPWKSLDDTAIWTQNWPWIPRPAGGERRFKHTTCTLCPAGCGVRARCIDGMPVSLAGIPSHPYGNGSLCAVGLAAHHLPFHPARVKQPLRRVFRHGTLESSVLSKDDAVALLIDAAGADRRAAVAVLDQRPGRSVSALYRRWLGGLPRGSYLVPPPVEDGTLRKAAELSGVRMGLDLEHAGTIFSVGTPLFEGWGSPGRMMRLAAQRRASGAPVILHAESRQSRTAQAADRWLPLNPGTELALALGLAHVLLRDGLAHRGGDGQREFRALAGECTPERSAAVTGIPAATIEETARYLADHGPVIVLGGGDAAAGPLGDEEQTALVLLNDLLGSVGTPGGLVPRAPEEFMLEGPYAPERQLHEVPDGTLDILILDGAESGCAIPWKAIEPKLRSDAALVVSLSPFLTGLARHAGLIIPAPVPLERWEDIPAPADAPAASFALSAPLFAGPDGATDPIELVQLLQRGAEGTATPELSTDLLRRRVAAIVERRRGRLCAAPSYTPEEPGSADQMFSVLAEGGVWIDDPVENNLARQPLIGPLPGRSIERMRARVSGRACAGLATGGNAAVTIVPFGVKGTVRSGQLSPILSKVFQESGLRPSDGDGAINPATARTCGLGDGDIAEVSAARGHLRVRVHTDASVMPGLLQVALGPDPAALSRPGQEPCSVIDLCLADDGTWRIARAGIGRANHG